MKNRYTLIFCLGLFSANTALPCETKRPSRPGSADIASQQALIDLRTGDVELLFEVKGKNEPFAVLWPLGEANAPTVTASTGEIFGQLEESAAPRMTSMRCAEQKLLGQSFIQKTSSVGLASIESAVIESDAELARWFQSSGFEEPDDLSSLKGTSHKFIAIRVEPQNNQAAIKLDFEAGAPLAWPRLTNFGAQGATALTLYVLGEQAVSLQGLDELTIDRDALASKGLSRNTFASSYQNAARQLLQNKNAMLKDAAVEVDGSILSRFQGSLYLDQMTTDITFHKKPGDLLSSTIPYCADSLSLYRLPGRDIDRIVESEVDPFFPGEEDGGGGHSLEITEDVPPGGGGGCSTTPTGNGSLFLLFGLLALVRSRRLALGAMALLGVACANPFNANTDNPPACTPRTFCDGAGLLHTVSCDGATARDVVSSCGDFSCNASTGACETCTPGELTCSNDQLTRCSADGNTQTLVESCEFGCSDTSASCKEFRASHIPTSIQETQGVVDVILQNNNGQPVTFFINADTGEIKRDNIRGGTIIREAGIGVKAGIAFAIVEQEQANAPALGVFVVKSLQIDDNVTLRAFLNDRPPVGEPSNALAIVAQNDVVVRGSIDVSAGEFTLKQLDDLAAGANTSSFTKLRNPGPGGYAGGETGLKGDGPGGGASPGTFGLNQGANGGLGFLAGGGGGGFGGQGGDGGKSFRNVSGGVGGVGYSDDALTVLLGGSGGGGGGNDPHFNNPVQNLGTDNPLTRNGGDGGGGGGAVQISALGPNGITFLEEAGINAGGAGGRHLSNGFCCHPGAGGGGAGGAIFLEARKVTLLPSSFLAANGGSGSGSDRAPSDACCDGTAGTTNTNAAVGGEGNAVGGDGGAGTEFNGKNGTTSITGAVSFTETQRGSGSGAGGGVGRIRINTFNDQSFEATGAILSPTSTFFTRGFLPLR
jgi:hypothetical protein